MKYLFLVGVCSFMALFSPATSHADEPCSYMPKYKLIFVYSKEVLENILIDTIVSRYKKNGKLNFEELSKCFMSLGKRYSVEYIPAAGLKYEDTVRFTIDRSNIWPLFLVAPGASNGVFTAIFRIVSPQKVAVIRRGGRAEWLRLE